MKGLILTLTLAMSLSFAACSGKGSNESAKDSHSQAVASEVQQGKAQHHKCGAMTKKGLPCENLVSDKNGKDAKCWRHQ